MSSRILNQMEKAVQDLMMELDYRNLHVHIEMCVCMCVGGTLCMNVCLLCAVKSNLYAFEMSSVFCNTVQCYHVPARKQVFLPPPGLL